MLPWFVILFFLPTVHPIGVPHYECGEHGRFEYCIDGIPGCVVGCHCHPGYYFDTESKICEPNAKLVHEYRKIYEPAEATVTTPRDSHEADTDAVPTTTEQAILKEADELGDWLYNQFFKTVENQIINKTDKPEDKPTRRKGDSGPQLQLSRRSGRRKSRKRKGGLRNKLLRITEDDSLFDSDSDDSSSRSSGSSDDSDTSSSSDTSKESTHKKPDDPGNSHTKDDEKEHGHRKVVIFNKKPKPPLPSFIFLPNYETPFYPPIGLPPPPALPMYPMVPVPPMIPMMQPSTPACNNQSTTEAPTSTTPTTPKDPANPTNEDPPKEHENDEHHTQELRMRKLRKMRMPPPYHRRNKLRESDVPWGDQQNAHPGGPPINDVDFKYLSQLIHKAGPNAMKTQPTRRKLDEIPANAVVNTRQLRDDEQQGFYSNLGQKIASLIRSADANRDQTIDSNALNQISKSIQGSQNSVFQNQYSYSPHSYWERYVRSPLRQFRAYGDPPQNYENYENLFNIESEVETVAETEKPLSLGELENALVLMNNAKVELNNAIDDEDEEDENESERNSWNTTSNRSWNVNLLVPNPYSTYNMQKTANQEKIQKTTGQPLIVPVPKQLPKIVTRNNTRTVESYSNNYSNLQGVFVQNFKNIVNNTVPMKNYTIASRSRAGSIPANSRAGSFTRRFQHIEPTDHQGTFKYPKQTLSGVTVHKIHLKPLIKSNNEQYHQYKPRSGASDIYRDEYDFFLAKHEHPLVMQRIVTRSPPIVKGSYFPTSYFHQSNHHNSYFDK